MGRQVRELAHARCGDKGDRLNVGVVAYDEESYEILAEHLTESRVASELDDLVDGPVTRYELENVHAFNFVLEEALDGGGSTTLRLDRLGKSTSFAILGIELDVE